MASEAPAAAAPMRAACTVCRAACTHGCPCCSMPFCSVKCQHSRHRLVGVEAPSSAAPVGDEALIGAPGDKRLHPSTVVAADDYDTEEEDEPVPQRRLYKLKDIRPGMIVPRKPASPVASSKSSSSSGSQSSDSFIDDADVEYDSDGSASYNDDDDDYGSSSAPSSAASSSSSSSSSSSGSYRAPSRAAPRRRVDSVKALVKAPAAAPAESIAASRPKRGAVIAASTEGFTEFARVWRECGNRDKHECAERSYETLYGAKNVKEQVKEFIGTLGRAQSAHDKRKNETPHSHRFLASCERASLAVRPGSEVSGVVCGACNIGPRTCKYRMTVDGQPVYLGNECYIKVKALENLYAFLRDGAGADLHDEDVARDQLEYLIDGLKRAYEEYLVAIQHYRRR